MAYVDDVCLAVIRVLESAAFHKDGVKLAGYRANHDYWLGEVRHALDCLEGYEARFARLQHARIEAAEETGESLNESHLKRNTSDEDIGRLRKRLLAAATRFFRLCTPAESVDDVETMLGIRVRDRRSGLD